ncbi:MAG TPA: hypothetical protein DET40_09400 [Lentisphaeria bacterium]|nr:MAG: hypothetical protein A2X45_08190 [Lentisphaerae bacterium GWF2_50_93]HCE43751.1 hypothetical protein [Lentisphaeria bacterium]
MKKLMLVIAVFFCGAVLVSAQGQVKAAAPAAQPEKKPLDQWTFFQIGFFPGVPESTKNSNVCGLKLGFPMVDGYGRVGGVEPSLFYSGTDYVKGVQATLVGPSIGQEILGVQTACVGPTIAKTVHGLQLSGMFNLADDLLGCGLGVANIAKSMAGFQISAVNVSEKVVGGQISAVNVSGMVIGAQVSAVNFANDELKGAQIGVVNYSKKNGCQLGLFNIIEDSPLPFTIIFNIKF